MISWVYSLVLIELAIVSWFDIKIKKIPNLWSLFNLFVGLSLHFLYPEAYPWQLASILFPLGWLVLGFGLFLVGVMGAGDSKLLASLFLLIPLGLQPYMLEKLIYSTVVVGIVMLLFKFSRDFQKIKAYAFTSYWKGFFEAVRSRFSYAPVALLAWLLLGVHLWK